MLVAVYGTLKKGFGNHGYLRGQKFLGKAVSRDRFILGHGGYPAVVPSSRGAKIVVEIYDVSPSTLLNLDSLEGYPVHYDRSKFDFLLNGKLVKAWLYFYHRQKSFHDWAVPDETELPFWWTKRGWLPYRFAQVYGRVV
jgi:gamma-glutamylcyclotransferase (GGCT)/AIG2-like uncharacterized protein YtfP